jgi:multidrug efflux pump subunit AcrA (membrane-fusion protein)
MFISLQLDISTETFDPAKIYVPINSIIFGQNDRYVYVLEGDKAIRETVEIGEIYGMWVEVSSGLNKNDLLIVEGHRNLPPAGDVEVNILE